MNSPTPLTLAAVGCGGRTLTYCSLATERPDRFRLVAVADPRPERIERMRSYGTPDIKTFASAKELFAGPRLADIAVIGTQDAYHVEPCLMALEKGYDVLLEKPIAPTPDECRQLQAAAERFGRRLLVCHVLRYAPFYRKVREVLDSGIIGNVVSLRALEGVDPWHQAHSFVRGHWAVKGKSNPMILAKCCHDLDLICWFMGGRVRKVGSHGNLSHFKVANAPEGAPDRCTDGCPVGESCAYNSLLYINKHRGWLRHVFDKTDTATNAEIREWLSKSPWGRCVYRCDNDVVDHQIVTMEFDHGSTASLTMTAFAQGRELEIYGTKGRLWGGDGCRRHTGADLIAEEFATGNATRWNIAFDGHGHGGADKGLVDALYREMTSVPAPEMTTSIQKSVHSHLVAFAAEEARITGKTIML